MLKTINFYKNLIVLFGVAFVPWNFVPRDAFVNVVFPELDISCTYGNCMLKTRGPLAGKDKCIVMDSNQGRVVIERVHFACQEFVGKTIVWQAKGEKLIGTITKAEKSY